jgi:hypothetical protein
MKAKLCIVAGVAWLAGILSAGADQAPVIIRQPQDAKACAGGHAAFTVEVTGDEPMGYLWLTNGVPTFDGVVSTPTNSTLTWNNVSFADDLATVQVLVNNPFGLTQSVVVRLFVPDPYFCTAPEDMTVPVGGTIQFQAHANGTPPLQYRWWFQRFASPVVEELTNSANVLGADTPLLMILNAGTTNAGQYWATVTNWLGMTATSAAANCRVGPPPTVTGPGSRIVRIYTATIFVPNYAGGGPRLYQWHRNDAPLPGATNSTLVLTNIQRPEVGLYHVVVSNPGGSVASEKAHLQVRLSLEGATPILREEATDVLDSLTNAVPAGFAPPPTAVFHGVPLLFSTYGATASAGEAARCGVPASHSMWVLYTSPRTETTLVSTEGSEFDTVVAVYTWDGNPTHAPTQIACDNDSGYDGQDSRLAFSAVAGQNYYLAVDGVGGATGTARLQVGENIRKVTFNRTAGTLRFEVAGPFWFETTLRHATSLAPPISWVPLVTRPATNRDWVLGYTNTTVFADGARYYSVGVNTNSAPP